MQRAQHRHTFSRARVSLGGIKYMLGLVATLALADKIKSTEERYLVMAGVGLAVGVAETAWREHVRKERNECQESDKGAARA